jgi:hypothetical protein
MRSRNHSGRGKAIGYVLNIMGVCVHNCNLVIRHANPIFSGSYYGVIRGLPVVPHFFTLPRKRHDFRGGGGAIDYKMGVLICSRNFL